MHGIWKQRNIRSRWEQRAFDYVEIMYDSELADEIAEVYHYVIHDEGITLLFSADSRTRHYIFIDRPAIEGANWLTSAKQLRELMEHSVRAWLT